jgi:hypothetical protein
MHCLEGSLLWQEILGDHLFFGEKTTKVLQVLQVHPQKKEF